MWRTRLTQDFLIGSDEGTKRTSALSPCPETNLASQIWAKASAPQNSRLWLLGSQLFPLGYQSTGALSKICHVLVANMV